MVCYEDKTFCECSDCAKWSLCHRALTEEIKVDAERKGFLICKFVKKPTCFKETNNECL